MSVMTKEKFVQQFTHDWFNHLSFGHLYRYHLDIPEENLRERVQSGSAFAASTFLDDWDQPVSDWILEKILQMDVPIRRWLDDDTQHGPFVLIRHIPQRYGTILVDVVEKHLIRESVLSRSKRLAERSILLPLIQWNCHPESSKKKRYKTVSIMLTVL